MKIQRLGFGYTQRTVAEFVSGVSFDRFDVLEPTIDFVRGGEDEARTIPALPSSFEHIERSKRVYLEIGSRILDGGRNRDLGGQMIDLIRVPDGRRDSFGVANISPDELEPASALQLLQPGKIQLTPATGKRVENNNVPPIVQQVLG
jgi:hypothetical protein